MTMKSEMEVMFNANRDLSTDLMLSTHLIKVRNQVSREEPSMVLKATEIAISKSTEVETEENSRGTTVATKLHPLMKTGMMKLQQVDLVVATEAVGEEE